MPAGRVERGSQAQEISSDIMVVSRDLHLRLVFAPRTTAVGASVDGQDVAVIGEPHPDPDRHSTRERPGALEPIAVHHASLAREAEARIEPAVVEQQEPGLVTGTGFDIALDLIALIAHDARDR